MYFTKASLKNTAFQMTDGKHQRGTTFNSQEVQEGGGELV